MGLGFAEGRAQFLGEAVEPGGGAEDAELRAVAPEEGAAPQGRVESFQLVVEGVCWLPGTEILLEALPDPKERQHPCQA